jgi:hypothetical protein
LFAQFDTSLGQVNGAGGVASMPFGTTTPTASKLRVGACEAQEDATGAAEFGDLQFDVNIACQGPGFWCLYYWSLVHFQCRSLRSRRLVLL